MSRLPRDGLGTKTTSVHRKPFRRSGRRNVHNTRNDGPSFRRRIRRGVDISETRVGGGGGGFFATLMGNERLVPPGNSRQRPSDAMLLYTYNTIDEPRNNSVRRLDRNQETDYDVFFFLIDFVRSVRLVNEFVTYDPTAALCVRTKPSRNYLVKSSLQIQCKNSKRRRRRNNTKVYIYVCV